jgi:hypothetical protein
MTACDRGSNTVAATVSSHDLIICGGTVYDGSGQPGRRVDLAINGDRIAASGGLSGDRPLLLCCGCSQTRSAAIGGLIPGLFAYNLLRPHYIRHSRA